MVGADPFAEVDVPISMADGKCTKFERLLTRGGFFALHRRKG